MTRLSAAVVLAIVLADEPASSGRQAVLSSETVILEPGDDTAVLYLVNDESWFQRGFARRKVVYLDDEPLGYLERGPSCRAKAPIGVRTS